MMGRRRPEKLFKSEPEMIMITPVIISHCSSGKTNLPDKTRTAPARLSAKGMYPFVDDLRSSNSKWKPKNSNSTGSSQGI